MEENHRKKALAADVLLCLCIAAAVGMVVFVRGCQGNGVTKKEGASDSSTSVITSSAAANVSSAAVSQSEQTAFQQSADWRLVLVNSREALPNSYQPQIVSCENIQIDERIEPPFLEMKAAAAKENISLWLTGGYRSEEVQAQLFEAEVQKYLLKGINQVDAENAAQKNVSKPGCSEHNTGLAVDLNGAGDDFVNSSAYSWLQKHAAEYGFILRYPDGKEAITGVEFQPWFYRYVGTENAVQISEGGLCLEEYLKFGE